MKKISCIVMLVLAMAEAAIAMIPGPPLTAECPKCGDEKKLMSLISGNTFGAVQWSDMYMHATMLPRLSPVQKCHGCGGYFLLSKAKMSHTDDDEYSSETGRLSFEEMKEALLKLEKDSLNLEEEFALRMEFLHRYNDAFRNYDDETDEDDTEDFFWKHSDEDKRLNHRNLMALIAMMDETDNDRLPLIAELYREAGEFEKCISIMKVYQPDSGFMRNLAEIEISKAEGNNDKIFILE